MSTFVMRVYLRLYLSLGSIMWLRDPHYGHLLDDRSLTFSHNQFDPSRLVSSLWHLGHWIHLHGLYVRRAL